MEFQRVTVYLRPGNRTELISLAVELERLGHPMGKRGPCTSGPVNFLTDIIRRHNNAAEVASVLSQLAEYGKL